MRVRGWRWVPFEYLLLSLCVMANSPAFARDAGFVPVHTRTDPYPGVVAIGAAPNCPGAQAVRARALAKELRSKGIPVQEISEVQLQFNDMSQAPKVGQMLESGGPSVFVHGKLAIDPTADQILAEYKNGAPAPAAKQEESWSPNVQHISPVATRVVTPTAISLAASTPAKTQTNTKDLSKYGDW